MLAKKYFFIIIFCCAIKINMLMILGIGNDLLNIRRIEKIYKKYQKSLNYFLSVEQIEFIENNHFSEEKKLNFIAKRFCAKEAVLKAIGIGLGRGIELKDISILNNELGKPEVFLNEKAIEIFEKTFNVSSEKINFFLALADEENFVNAVAVIILN